MLTSEEADAQHLGALVRTKIANEVGLMSRTLSRALGVLAETPALTGSPQCETATYYIHELNQRLTSYSTKVGDRCQTLEFAYCAVVAVLISGLHQWMEQKQI